MAEVASAYISLMPSLKGFGASIDKQAGGDIKKSGSKMGATFGKLFAAAAGGLAVKNFFSDSLAEAREAQKVGALTAAVIKSTGGAAKVSSKQVEDLASAISKRAGIDDDAIQSGANLLLTFKDIRNEAGKGNDIFNQATTSMVDLAAGLAAASGGSLDMRSASTLMGKALNDPVKGLSALSRVGVQFSEKQKAAIKKMVESGDTMGAQKAILKELNAQFGGAAASQATAADKAGVAWGELKEQIGTQLLPVADKLASFATGKLIPALSGTATWVGKNKTAIGLTAGAITAGVLAAKAYTLVTGIMAAITAAQAVAAGTATTAQIGLNTAMKANIIGIVVTALVALVAGLVYAYKHSETFRNAVNGLWSTCRKVFAFIADKFLGMVGVLVHGAAKAFGWVPGIGPKLKAAAANFDKFRDQVNGSLAGIKDRDVHITAKITEQLVRSGAMARGQRDPEHRAMGGPVTAGMPYKVGENGEELFIPRTSGRIIPNHELGRSISALGAGSMNVYVRIGDEDIEGYITAISDDTYRGWEALRGESRRAY